MLCDMYHHIWPAKHSSATTHVSLLGMTAALLHLLSPVHLAPDGTQQPFLSCGATAESGSHMSSFCTKTSSGVELHDSNALAPHSLSPGWHLPNVYYYHHNSNVSIASLAGRSRHRSKVQHVQQPQVPNPFTAAGLQQHRSHTASTAPSHQTSQRFPAGAVPAVPASPPSKQTFNTSGSAAATASTPTFQFGTSQAASSSPQPGFPGFGTAQQAQTTPGAFPGFAAGTAASISDSMSLSY